MVKTADSAAIKQNIPTRRRGGGGPLQGPRIPRIISRNRALKHGPQQVPDKNQDRDALHKGADGDEQVPKFPATARLIGVDAARHAQQTGNVHEIESQVEANDEKPEMPSR